MVCFVMVSFNPIAYDFKNSTSNPFYLPTKCAITCVKVIENFTNTHLNPDKKERYDQCNF